MTMDGLAVTGPSPSAPVAIFEGTTMVTRSSAAWQVIGGTVGYTAPDCVYANGGFAQMDLDLPAGAKLVQVDVYGRAGVFPGQAFTVDWRTGDGSASGTHLGGTGFYGDVTQTTMTAPLAARPVVGVGHQVVVNCSGATGRSAGNAVGAVVVQYVDPRPTYRTITPIRVYDSRWPGGLGEFHAPDFRYLGARDAHDLTTGATTQVAAVPEFAKAVSFNLTAVATSPLGYLAVTPSGSGYDASAINWSRLGETVANSGAVALDPSGNLFVWAGGGSAQFIMDVTGYYF